MAAPKNVTNPMTTDLDGGNHAIYNVHDAGLGAVATWKVVLFTQNFPNASGGLMAIFGGQDDPTQPGGPRDPFQGIPDNQPVGSLYSQQVGGVNGTTATLWFKAGPNPTDWVKVAGA